MTDRYDVIVIGGGAAGENAAGSAREHGLSVALVERDLVGGECSYWACMPSKALLRPGEVLAAARRVPGAAPAVTGAVDVAAALRRRDAITHGWDDRAQVDWLQGQGAVLVRGVGRLAGDKRVEVEMTDGSRRTLVADHAVVLATGSSAAFPPVEGLDTVQAWDNRDITAATRIPERLLVLGGGAVGVEMAQAFHRLGSREVTVVELFDRILAFEEPFVGAELAAAFEAEGIAVRTSTTARKASRRESGEVVLTLDDGDELVGDELLVATGRRPRTVDIGLETVGLEPGKRVEVDDQLRANGVEGGWLFAVGDVNGRALLTHQGKYQARVLGDVLAGRDTAAVADRRAVPRVVFTDPQVAAVGLIEQKAREAGHDVRVLTRRVSDTAAGALYGSDTVGTAQLVVDRVQRVILGATFTGPNAAELMHAATIAIVGNVPLDDLWHAVPAFPTVSEVWLRLLEAEQEA